MTDDDVAITPSWAALIRKAIEARLAVLETGVPARVVSFDGEHRTAVVQPLMLRVVLDEANELVEERIPQIQNVPVIFPGGGGWSLRWPLNGGDIVYLTIPSRSIDRWMEAQPGQEVVPELTRKHDLSDAIAIAELRPRAFVDRPDPGPDLVLGRNDGSVEIRLSPDGVATITAGDVRLGSGAERGVARGGDQTTVDLQTDQMFVNFMAGVHAGFNALLAPQGPARAAYAALVPVLPTTVTGAISSASDIVKSE